MSDPNLVGFAPKLGRLHPDAGAVVAFLKRRHSVKTAEFVAADTGVPRETIAGWLKGRARPSFAHALRLVAAYGPAFIAAVYPGAPAWVDAATREARRGEVEAALAALRAELDELTRPQDAGISGSGARGRRSGADRRGGGADCAGAGADASGGEG